MTPLEAAVYAAKGAWNNGVLADSRHRASDERAKAYLVERDECYRECGRQIALAKALHARSGINVPWQEWATQQFGWSYATIHRRMQDHTDPGKADERRAKQQERDNISRNPNRETSGSPAVDAIIDAYLTMTRSERARFVGRVLETYPEIAAAVDEAA